MKPRRQPLTNSSIAHNSLSGRPTAATYHRCSTTDQDPTLARAELQAAAAARGLEVVLEVEETGSGARNDRPGLQQILAAARKGQVTTLLVWKLDRFGRSALDLLHNIRQLEDAGVRFVAISQGIDVRPGGDPMGRLMITMLGAIAEFERDLIIERTRLGLAAARAAGVTLGRPRVARPLRADVARLRGQGLSWSQVARELGCKPSTAARRMSEAA